MAQADPGEPDLLLRFSSLTRLLHITAWCRRWLRHKSTPTGNQRARTSGSDASPLSVIELEEAQNIWIRQVQAAAFEKELAASERGEEIKKKIRLPV